MQNTDTILMVRPYQFGRNPETAETNAFQQRTGESPSLIHEKALQEFDNFVKNLRQNGVQVVVVNDRPEPHTPDSIFPNNWVTFHDNGTVILYPMEAENRRWERRRSILDLIETEFVIIHEIDLSHYEADHKFLEGTGSMIFDRENKICYACRSSRMHEEVLADFAEKTGFETIVFDAVDATNFPIYHTNVMMSVNQNHVIIGLDCLPNLAEKQQVIHKIEATGKEIITLSQDQIAQFAGNMLEVRNQDGDLILVMSERAFKSLTPTQIKKIEKSNKIVHSPLDTIEDNGGGSARCMMAEIFLPKK